MNMETLLQDRVEKDIDGLETMELGSKEHTAAVEDVVKLADRLIEIKKCRASEVQTEKQMREEWIKQFIKICVDVGLKAAEIALLIWGIKMSWRFEEEGTITSQTGKKVNDRFFRLFSK